MLKNYSKYFCKLLFFFNSDNKSLISLIPDLEEINNTSSSSTTIKSSTPKKVTSSFLGGRYISLCVKMKGSLSCMMITISISFEHSLKRKPRSYIIPIKACLNHTNQRTLLHNRSVNCLRW
jgi:hypothetical protein